jgi:hypothetical protein
MNTDEIRMEITSWFVKTHEYWETYKGKNWIARIIGLDKRYGYQREFLETVRVGKEQVFHVKDFHLGDIYEVASLARGAQRFSIKDTYECVEITETDVVLQCIPQEGVIKRLTDRNRDIIAESLVQQLLRIVTKEQAVVLIETISR